MTHYIIKVTGAILATSCVHYAQNWVCYGMGLGTTCENKSYEYNKDTHSVNSDLTLNETRRAVPYACYCAKKDIAVVGKGGISGAPGYLAALKYFKEHISKISTLLEFQIPDEIEQTVYHGLYTDAFSILELFLSDIILCMIYSNDTIYNKAVQYYKVAKPCKNEVQELERKVHNFFFNEVVYHKFDKVKDIFTSLIGIKFPDTKDLRNLLHKRNNIVHRYSFSNIDRMTVVKITQEDVRNLIKVSNTFVNNLIDNINNVYIDGQKIRQ